MPGCDDSQGKVDIPTKENINLQRKNRIFFFHFATCRTYTTPSKIKRTINIPSFTYYDHHHDTFESPNQPFQARIRVRFIKREQPPRRDDKFNPTSNSAKKYCQNVPSSSKRSLAYPTHPRSNPSIRAPASRLASAVLAFR